MRRSKVLAALASVAMSIGATAVIAAPAHADTPTTVKFNISGKSHVKKVYGDYLGGVSGKVEYTSATSGQVVEASNGTTNLEAKKPGKAWKVVGSDDSPGFLYFPNSAQKAKGNVKYRAHFLGGTYTDANGVGHTLDPSYSGAVKVDTFYKITVSSPCTHGCKYIGKIAPKYKHKKVLMQVKRNGHWKKYSVVKTNAKSKFVARVRASRGKGTIYRCVVKGNKKIHATAGDAYIYRIY